ncbi:DUF5682 family protein [Micromonospora sp. BRA006-A]|nr:DUF5682 family protein [Micromonospora sp. BRA006-A]
MLLGLAEPHAFGAALASWAEMPAAECTDRLRGALSVAGALLEAGGETLAPLLDTVDGWDDEHYIRRLPALRGGFDALSPADRDRLLDTVRHRIGDLDATMTVAPSLLADWLAVDQKGRQALTALGLPAGTATAPPSGRVHHRPRQNPARHPAPRHAPRRAALATTARPPPRRPATGRPPTRYRAR